MEEFGFQRAEEGLPRSVAKTVALRDKLCVSECVLLHATPCRHLVLPGMMGMQPWSVSAFQTT
ncbi:hypothetical protein LMG27177_03886 [Paraburkholderia fynbosensis]|uniref:Uncharacterized protein n=1 Tax=Paraburkholderia fynbosensis TaxID=1200993 RepID=A0A6J5G8S0_9BURK|nr:hypothetical protein LMG27177_03886 [Paraburkholderia fynbosensis]